MNRFPNLIHRALLFSTLFIMVGSVAIYGQNKDSTKINTSQTDSLKSKKVTQKKSDPFSFITRIFISKEKKEQQTASTDKNNLLGVKKADTAKQASNKGQATKQTTTKSDTTKKKSTVDVSKDSSETQSPFERKMKSFISSLDKAGIHGTINAGYDYGVLPFASDMQVPMGYYHSDGQGQFKIGMLPFNGSYYYSGLKTITGLNNYFRISFDSKRFMQQYSDKSYSQEDALKNKLAGTYKERQVAEQKLLYLESQEGKPTSPGNPLSGENPTANTNGINKAGKMVETDMKDSLGKDEKKDSLSKGAPKDTVKAPKEKAPSGKSDSTTLAKDGKQSLTKDTSKVGKNDSTQSKIKKYNDEIKRYDDEIEKINKEISIIEKARKNPGQDNPYMGKMNNFLSGVKKLDIGLCYPEYSTFLVSGMAVKGINLEYEKNAFYLAATEGTTVNTMLFTNNSLQNHLVNMQNLYNMFDFQSVQSGRKILDFKTGYGTKEGTHFLVGFLYGTGMPSYLNTYNPGPETGLSKNYVLELDAKWAFTKTTSFNLIYGKSSTQTSGEYYSNSDGGIFNSNKSKAAMGIYKWDIKETKTKLTLTSRWVAPYFNSFGIGYMRTDNFRYEIKVEQIISKKIKFSVFYRKDEDNIIPLYSFNTVLQTIGTNLTLKPLRSLTIRLGYIPVIEHMWGTNPNYNNFNHNNISNILLTYTPPVRGAISTVFNLAYNYYRLTTDTQTIAYQNISFSNLTQFKNSFNNNFSVTWFKTSPGDSLNNDVLMAEEEPGFSFKSGCTVSVGGKAAWSESTNVWQFGYEGKVHIPLIKHLSCEVNAEKLVLGDFYSSFDIAEIKRFPYFGQGKIIYSF